MHILHFLIFLEKELKRVSNGLSSNAEIASWLIETAINRLQEIASEYKKISTPNQDGVEKIQHDYLKSKVRELIKLLTHRKGAVLTIHYLTIKNE